MVTKPYDIACFELAEYFLRDEPSVRGDPELFALCCNDLAQEIQNSAENWLFIHMPVEHDEWEG
jgi:hypothetical protein